MRAYILQISAIVASIVSFSASQATSLPDCAKSCAIILQTGGPDYGCQVLDIACICSNQDFIGTFACCIDGNCDTADQKTSFDYVVALCSAAGVQVSTDNFVCGGSSASTTSHVTSTSTFVPESTKVTSSQASLSSETSSSVPESSITAPTSLTRTGSSSEGSLSSTASILPTPPSSTAPVTASPLNSSSATPSDSGLSTGAKAGIGVGIVCAIGLIVVVLLIFIWRRRKSGRGSYFRRRTRPASGLPDGENVSPTDPTSTIPEMETRANTHEISSKVNAKPIVQILPAELSNDSYSWNNPDARNEPHIVEDVAQAREHSDASIQYPIKANSSALQKVDLPQAHELDNFRPADGKRGIKASQTHPTVPSELEVQSPSLATVRETPQSQINPQTEPQPQPQPLKSFGAVPRKSLPSSNPSPAETTVHPETTTTATSPTPSPPLAASAVTAPAESSGSGESSRLDFLRARIDKVREEKERLARLQELEYLEAELQREIMEEQRREYGVGTNLK